MHTLVRSWRPTLSVATAFWAACLFLVTIEATIGWPAIVGSLFLLSIPVLVVCLTWVNRGYLSVRKQGLSSVVLLGVSILFSSTLIILVGLVVAVRLKTLIVGA